MQKVKKGKCLSKTLNHSGIGLIEIKKYFKSQERAVTMHNYVIFQKWKWKAKTIVIWNKYQRHLIMSWSKQKFNLQNIYIINFSIITRWTLATLQCRSFSKICWPFANLIFQVLLCNLENISLHFADLTILRCQ